jgi:hypothetical protein
MAFENSPVFLMPSLAGLAATNSPMLFPLAGGSGAVIKLGELVMILDLHRQGLSVSAIGVEAVKAGRSVYFGSLADIVGALAKAEREGALREKIRFFCRFALLIVDEIGYLPVIPGGGNLFFQLVNARYEKGAMILTSNRGFSEWGQVFGDPVVATALLDRLLHHATVIQIEGASYRLREHADLVPENIRSKSLIQPSPTPPTLKRRGRPAKNGDLDQHHG